MRDSLNTHLAADKSRPEAKKKHPVRLKRERKRDRARGWSWVHSRYRGKGAIRYRWNPRLRILECWAVTQKGNRPSQIIGDFIEMLLDTQKTAINSIHIEVG